MSAQRRRCAVRLAPLALLLAIAGASGCSLLVDGEPMPLRCSQEGKVGEPACDPGAVCRSGLCELLTSGQGGASGAGGVADAGHGGA